MQSKSNLIIYAAAAFVVFMAITWILREFSGKLPVDDAVLWGIYKKSDFFLGIVVAGIITLSRYQKRKLRK